jgi:four helix bundle protein
LNIAEGSGKSSDKELNRYFDIALGSLYEVLASADSLKRNNLLDEPAFSDIFQRVNKISNQIGGFKRSISCRKS